MGSGVDTCSGVEFVFYHQLQDGGWEIDPDAVCMPCYCWRVEFHGVENTVSAVEFEVAEDFC